MKPREKKSKISNYSLTVFFYLITLFSIGCAVWSISEELGFGIFFIVIALFSLCMAVFWTFVSKEIHNRYLEMYKLYPVVRDNYARVQEELEKIGFKADEKYSSCGYSFFEMRDDFSAPDNVNIEIDNEREEICLYVLSPFSFKRKSRVTVSS